MKRAAAVLLVAIAIWEIVATRCAATSVPDDDAWTRASAVVRESYKPGDLIVFAPEWIDPTGRMHLGDLIPIEAAARMDEARFTRVWELSIRGAGRDEKAAFAKDVDGITVRRFDRLPAGHGRLPVTVLADILALAGANVTLAEVGFQPHRCVQAAPTMRLTYPVPAGKLVGYAGIPDVFTRRSPRNPVTVDVEVDGKVITSVTVGVDDGWKKFEANVPAGDVTFVAKGRLACLAAEVRQ